MRTRRRRATTEDLRLAIECLPRATRIAMLEGIRANPIIAGAYTSPEGICPMLAAHRAGGRTNAISFARAWDLFAFGGARAAGPRPATERELRILVLQLECSLLEEEAPAADLGAAIASHRELVSKHANSRRDESPARPGWSWTRVVRSYDEYERVLAQLERERSAAERRLGSEPVAPPQRPRVLA